MENQRFHAAAWKDQTVGAPERMEDNIIAYVSDERIHGEQSTFFLNVDSENMETSNTEEDSFGTGGHNRDINPEEMFKEGAVISVEAFEIPEINGVDDENNKRSKTVRSETCFDIDNLAENCTKELRSTLKIPDPDAFGKNETSHSMQSCLEVQCPEESVTLQGARLTLDAFKTEFHLNSEGTKMKELLTEMDFSGNLSKFWDQGTHSRLLIIPDLNEEKEQFSFHITACNEQIAGKKVGGTHASNCVSNEEQSEQSAFTLNVVNQNKVEAENEVGVCGEGSSYSGSSYDREIKTEGTDFREKVIVTGEPSESPNQNCDNDKKGSRTILVKPCQVVLKELGKELEEKCEDSLINLDIETQSLKMQNERNADPLQVLSHGIPEKNYVKKQNKIIKIQNIKMLLKNEKLNIIEKKEIKNPEKVITSRGSKNMDTKIHHNSEEPQAEGSLTQMDSTDLSDMIEEGIFSRLSLMEKEYKSSAINLFHEEEEDPGAKKLQTDFCSLSSMTPQIRKGKSRAVTSVTMFRKNWNKLIKQLGREEISSSSLVMNPSGGTLQTEDLQGIPVEGTSTYLSVIKAENVFDEGKSHNRSPLLPAQSHSEDIRVTDCKPSCISTPVVEKLETNLKGELLCTMKNQLPRLESVVQCFLAESSQEVSEGQLNVEEQKSLNQRNFKSTNESDNSSCFLMEVAEDLDNVDDVNITEGQKKAVQQKAGGEHLNPSKITLQSQSMEVPEFWRPEAEWHSRSDNIKKIKHNDIKKTTALHCLEPPGEGHIRCIEKVTPEPAKETYHAEKMAGPVVGLLGVPSKGCKPRRLQRLVELEDSSDDEPCVCCQPPKKMSRSVLGVTSSKAGVPHKMRRVEDLEDLSDDVYDDFQVTQEIKDRDYHPTLCKKEVKQLLKPYAAHVLWQKPLNSHCSNKKKRKDRRSAPKEASASVPSLQMSEEQSRIKVIDSLRGMLLKRLEESPDLDVHEDTILRLANNVEKEIFNLFLCVDQRYRNKYRSLLFNLKAPKNKLLFHQVVLGEVSPQCLVQMNSLEMAPKELAEWRAKESKHVLEVIEKQQREPPRCCPTKLTHKGEIEIHSEVDEDFTLEDLYGSVLCIDKRPISKPTTESKRDTTDQHRSHLLDPDCLICTGRMAPDGERGFNPPRSKSSSKKKAEGSSRLHSTTVCSEKGRRHLEKGRPASTDNLKKNPGLQRQAKDTVLWEGFIQMFSIKQFAAKAYPVSGYSTSLIQALPELIQSRGCILPEDVWDYLESIWPAEAKEMSVIQFCPTITKDFSAYNMLYSYLNNKQRYGIVDSNQMEMFMVPLPAFQPVPAKFHPLGGPGLDANHSCLLLGLILPKKASDDHSANGTGLLRKTKRKTVTFKDTLVTKCISPPLDSSGSAQLAETFQQVPSRAFTGNCLSRDKYPPAVSHSQEPLTTNNVFALNMAMGEVLNGGPCHGASSSCCQNSKEEPNQSMQDCAFHSFSSFPWMGEQSYATAQESLGWQQNMMGGHTTFHADAGPAPSQYWNLGPLSSCSLCSHDCSGNVAFSASVLDIQQLSSMLCPGVTSSGGPSQVPSVPQLVSHEPSATSDLQSHAATGDSNPEVPVEEALSLIQHLEALVQLNSQIQNQTLFSHPSLDLTASLQAAALRESQIVGGATFPPVQQESGVYPQSQLSLPPFCGPAYPPPGC
nr:SPOC domain-containing protein 1 [Pelodiscus sinensis]XP_025037686.1 SPOC domain-containing protein 1 [Pelodiscus sinensis]XP_025037687.1 SPOC domain-containing protein 1 [Pelodiscus sinensis]XP_025037688.1 SPOC domain-containing protein 1 [Pelodiscus sinensis]|eukprot:XP_014426209.1 SPOC domain-containing protein 1 [Pelodiscus sinensis]